MLNVHIEKIGDVAVVQCEGRIVRSDAVFRLRNAVTQQIDARVILLDLSDVETLGGGGLGMLVFLQQWSRKYGIELKLFDPPDPVRRSLERVSSTTEFDVASSDEILSLLGWEGRNCMACQEDRHTAVFVVKHRNQLAIGHSLYCPLSLNVST